MRTNHRAAPVLTGSAEHPHPLELIGPPDRIGQFRQMRLRSLGLADRAQRVAPDSLGHTPLTRQIQAEVRSHEITADHWATDHKRDLEVERAVIVGRLRRPVDTATAPPPGNPTSDTTSAARVEWAQAERTARAQALATATARAARLRDQDRLAEITATIEEIERDAEHVKARWREHYDQQVAIYTRARTGKDDPRSTMPPYAPYPTLEDGDLLALLPAGHEMRERSMLSRVGRE